MNKNFFISAMLVMALVFGMTVIGCNNGTTEENETWSDVTSIAQVNGSWKAPSSYSVTNEGMTSSSTYNNFIITFNAAAKTMSQSGSMTGTFSGGNIDELWPILKQTFDSMSQQDGVTATFNDANHSYTITYNNYSMALTDSILAQMGFKINQKGTKLKLSDGGVIYTKQ
jgi:uncharacterized lipoprotein NlpE involved in copper resistance